MPLNTSVQVELYQMYFSEQSSWNKEQFAESAAKEELESKRVRVRPQDILPGLRVAYDDLHHRATVTKGKADRPESAKSGRESGIRERLETCIHSSSENLLADESSTPEPKKQVSLQPLTINMTRAPYRWRANMSNEPVDGEIIASDQAYTDMVLDQGSSLPRGTTWADFIVLDSFCDKFSEDQKIFQYANEHIIKYNGEPIWKLKTKHSCNGTGTWGQSSFCTLMIVKGILRVNIIHKGRTNMGQGWNSHERREYELEDMIKKAGEVTGRDVLSLHFQHSFQPDFNDFDS